MNNIKHMVKCILSGIIIQALIMAIHLLLHMIEFNNVKDFVPIICSFIIVVLITYLAVLFLRLPIYVIFTAQIVTILFILFLEDDGVYLLYYLHKGQSQWFNPSIYADIGIVVLEMVIIQLLAAKTTKLTEYVCLKKGKL